MASQKNDSQAGCLIGILIIGLLVFIFDPFNKTDNRSSTQTNLQQLSAENRKFDERVLREIKPYTLESVRGDQSTYVFHAVDHTRCSQYDLISDWNSRFFNTYTEAYTSGFVPCNLCYPIAGQHNAFMHVVGNNNSMIYHKSGSQGCEYSNRIAPENRINFVSVQHAKSKGFRACKLCFPSDDPPSRISHKSIDIEDIDPNEYYIDSQGRAKRGSDIIDEYNESVRDYNKSQQRNNDYDYLDY